MQFLSQKGKFSEKVSNQNTKSISVPQFLCHNFYGKSQNSINQVYGITGVDFFTHWICCYLEGRCVHSPDSRNTFNMQQHTFVRSLTTASGRERVHGLVHARPLFLSLSAHTTSSAYTPMLEVLNKFVMIQTTLTGYPTLSLSLSLTHSLNHSLTPLSCSGQPQGLFQCCEEGGKGAGPVCERVVVEEFGVRMHNLWSSDWTQYKVVALQVKG